MSSTNSSQPLNISIVGAGIGGLTAAVALRRNGHIVQIFEAAEIKSEIGAALGIQANSLRVLDHLGVSRNNLKGVPWRESVVFDRGGGEGTRYKWLVPAMDASGLFVHRSDLYEELKRLATGEGEGPPAKLRLGTKVVACDPEEGTVTLNTGEVVQADAVIGADGIHSVIRTDIIGGVEDAQSSGLSCFRTVLEASNLQNIPELEWFYGGVSGTRSVITKEGPFRMLLFYQCRGGSLVNVVAFYPDSLQDEAAWTPTATLEEVTAMFWDFDPKFLRMFDLPVHSSVHRWKLEVVPLLPTWIRGRAVLLGDAAHGTLPLLGQGAGMAIEEAGAVGCLLPSGTRREDIPDRLRAYQDLRKQRGEFVNRESLEQASKTGFDMARSKELQLYLLEYDAVKAAETFFQERFGGAPLAVSA
ncbi:FAD/NAD(P)-binding domain-containing protein [Mycena galericulata]|nr:FAD/NAD(P)-binding domain-containing protein [Mycena galericulata]